MNGKQREKKVGKKGNGDFHCHKQQQLPPIYCCYNFFSCAAVSYFLTATTKISRRVSSGQQAELEQQKKAHSETECPVLSGTGKTVILCPAL